MPDCVLDELGPGVYIELLHHSVLVVLHRPLSHRLRRNIPDRDVPANNAASR